MSDIKNKEELDEVFEQLEKQGIVTRANFGCCNECNKFVLVSPIESKNKSGDKLWNQQNNKGNTEKLYIYYSGGDMRMKGAKSKQEVANIIYEEFIKYGFDISKYELGIDAFVLNNLKL